MAFRSRSEAAFVSTRGSGPVDVVDAALTLAARRELFTADEALELLRGVRDKVHDGPLVALAEITIGAEESYSCDAFIDHGRVIDALLDMRIALSA
jgi:hypothetical protein